MNREKEGVSEEKVEKTENEWNREDFHLWICVVCCNEGNAQIKALLRIKGGIGRKQRATRREIKLIHFISFQQNFKKQHFLLCYQQEVQQ